VIRRPDRDQVLAELRQTIAEAPDDAVVLAEDETHINLLPRVRVTWIAHGQHQLMMTPGTNQRRSVFGAVGLASGRMFYQVCRKAVSATFIAFLARLLADHPRILVVRGARYSPHDNPIERSGVRSRRGWPTHQRARAKGRLRQVHAFFATRSPAQILATAAPHCSPWLPDGYAQNPSGSR